ncbi:MAG: glycogen-binding domain-containing protein [Lentisphaeria bacterium]|nr:glycogen-binding domain-containing protein [Lentisphaeria bacterium]
MSAKRVQRKGMRRVAFSVDAPVGSSVYLAASFNGWDPAVKPMKDTAGDGRYSALCMLPPGTYEYKYVIDGDWSVDPANPNFVLNSMGTLNSVVEVS